MSRPSGLLARLRLYGRTFSWREVALLKTSDLLTTWWQSPVMRRTRALRGFTQAVPLESVSLEFGEYRFRWAVGGEELSFRLRAGSSDVDAFQQVMVEEAYGDLVRLIPPRDRPLRILDAGANIGLTTLFLKAHLPGAQILALEPEPANFLQLRRCLADNALEDVTALNVGIWTRDTDLVPQNDFRDGRAWSFALRERAGEDEAAAIPVRSLETLLAQAGWRDVDLLKMDVEGAEGGLLRNPEFLRVLKEMVGLVCMEVHEEAIPVPEAREALESLGMRTVRAGETLLAWRRP